MGEIQTMVSEITVAHKADTPFNFRDAVNEMRVRRSRKRASEFIGIVAGKVNTIPLYAWQLPKPPSEWTTIEDSGAGGYVKLGDGWLIKDADVAESNQAGLFLLANGLTYPSWGIHNSSSPDNLNPQAPYSTMHDQIYDGRPAESFALQAPYADDQGVIMLARAAARLTLGTGGTVLIQ